MNKDFTKTFVEGIVSQLREKLQRILWSFKFLEAELRLHVSSVFSAYFEKSVGNLSERAIFHRFHNHFE